MVISNINKITSSFQAMILCLLAILCASNIMEAVQASIVPQQEAEFDTWSDICREKVWPIVSGGDRREEVHCQLLWENEEKTKQYIITAGNTTSDKYVPSSSPPHAYMYALDNDGNWKWGKFYYNQSITIQSITGCQVNDLNNILFTGLSDPTKPKPYIMEVNPETGKTENFISFEKVVADDSTLYTMTKGLFHDTNDPDGQQYYYASFVYNTDKMLMLKANRDSGQIVWNHVYQSEVSTSQN